MRYGRLTRDFAALYSVLGRRSVPAEKLMPAMLLQVFHSVRSERRLMERIEFDLLFRWFVGIGIDDPVCDHSSLSHQRIATGRWKVRLPPNSWLGCYRSRRCGGCCRVVERAFLGGRHADQGVGLDEELQAKEPPNRVAAYDLLYLTACARRHRRS
jgi:hypothetical protein